MSATITASRLSAKGVKTPFNMIVVGMTGCGKTHYVLKMLEDEYPNHFEHIFLLCPTYEWNKTYQEWSYNADKNFIVLPCTQDDIDPMLRFVVGYAKGTNSLIILDDCASSQAVKNRVGELINLAFSARHYGLSTIVITQQLTSVAKPYRENISKLVTFYNPSKKDMGTIIDDYLDVDKDSVGRIKEFLKNNEHARMEVLLRSPYGYTLCK